MKRTALTIEIDGVKYRAYSAPDSRCRECDLCRLNNTKTRMLCMDAEAPCTTDAFVDVTNPIIYKREAI